MGSALFGRGLFSGRLLTQDNPARYGTEFFVSSPRRAHALAQYGCLALQLIVGNAEYGRAVTQEVLLPNELNWKAEGLAGQPKGFAKEVTLGCVNERMRCKNRGELGRTSAGPAQDARTSDTIPLTRQLAHDILQRVLRHSMSRCSAAIEEGLSLSKIHLACGVIRLQRADSPAIGQLYSPPSQNDRNCTVVADGDKNGPAGVCPESDSRALFEGVACQHGRPRREDRVIQLRS
jgi:hypothetical protein